MPGGIGRYVRHLVAALPGAGVAPVAFAAGARPEGIDGCYVDLGRPTGALRYEAWHRLRRPVVRAPGDVVHAASLAVPPPGPRPLVVTVHDLVFLRQPALLTARGAAFHRRGLELARLEASAVIVPTAFGRDDLLDEGFDPALVHVAHHGVALPASPADPDAENASLTRRGVRPPFVLFVGTIEPRKGVPELLAAHAALRVEHPELDLVLAGPAGWGPAPELSAPGVRWLGGVDDLTLDALYRAAVALALPSRYEGFGLPVAEAMARSCPVVVSDAACLPEVAGGAGMVVATGDADALAGALGGLLADRDRRDERAAAGRARAASFTWAASAAAHARAYGAALEAGR
ncbi:MAG: glycosyltransferase family 4 protein [Actinobacteria bacterium]|nr:glycosyltransferase family 4 protein [Actinomycetota bacterium]MBW3641703.1 glycosyltransferase family 4 protein [Actinomycetota bacterium]